MFALLPLLCLDLGADALGLHSKASVIDDDAMSCDFPVYDFQTWVKENGHVGPDHAAVFKAGPETMSWPAFQWKDPWKDFLGKYGDYTVQPLPEYAQAGGHLAFAGVPVRGYPNVSLNDAIKTWDKDHLYFNDFKCASELCAAVKDKFITPPIFDVKVHSSNFLVGGKNSGLPFHHHGQTWQGLTHGLKAWQIIPKGLMSEELEKATGPYTIPVRSWSPKMKHLPIGKRPLYCVQKPGEIVWIPSEWWHATENLADLNIAWGAKPKESFLMTQHNTPKRHEQEMYFRESQPTTGLYDILGRLEEFKRSGNINPLNQTLGHLESKASEEEPEMAAHSKDHPLRSTAAFAYCVIGESANRSEWKQKAAQLDYEVYDRQCGNKHPTAELRLGRDAHVDYDVRTQGSTSEYVKCGQALMPTHGFGTCCRKSATGEPLIQSLLAYLKHGGRLIDTAFMYGNHLDIAEALRRTDVPNKDIWITSKIMENQMGSTSTKEAVDQALRELNVTSLNLMLIHLPGEDKSKRIEAWRALIEAKRAGKVKEIGVSNFNREQIEELISETGEKPANNQIEMSPFAPEQTNQMAKWMLDNDISITAYGSLGHSKSDLTELNKKTKELQSTTGKSLHQILLRWAVDNGFAVVPGATSEQHIADNLDIHDFKLSADAMTRLSSMSKPRGWKYYPHFIPER
jgi:diketogulonate reductase-like aldo/keto reductase